MDSGLYGAVITVVGGILLGLVTWLLNRRPAKKVETNVNYDQIQEDLAALRAEVKDIKRNAANDLAQMRLEMSYQRDITRILDNEVMDLRQGMSEVPPRYPPLPPRPPWPVMP